MSIPERDPVEPEISMETSIDQIVEWGEFTSTDDRCRDAAPWAMSTAAVYAHPRHNARLTCYRGRVLGVGQTVGGVEGVSLTVDVAKGAGQLRLYAIRLDNITRIESWNPETSEHEAGIDEDFAL